ncbi:uncharacterized protein LOC109725938 isoform X2 [Ananas comosus]|uniref:Uncharacterized protein LOC109725938 isoform X2 n=1 Tax=Ananas comosus TaxID=4615 RepID=A0A6P5GZ46_ANACO|nr:uncharacterized protein LOC109725938 isoform X2 [Ananas comosus]
MSCPENAFRYNGTQCACDPGHYLVNKSCLLFSGDSRGWVVGSGVSAEPQFFLTTVLSLDSIRRLTQSQAVLLEVTLVTVVAWLAFCFAVRLGRVDGGRSTWFRIRWWISRFDFTFDTRHWLEDQQVVVKRKTELGGTFSVASSILFIGLLSALLYQVIMKRSIEVHKIRPANAPDLLSFVNDLEFNITAISSMTCSHLRGPRTVVLGTPGFIDYRVFPLSKYMSYSCQNTSMGPTVSVKCSGCRIPWRNHYISWQFVDLPNDPATAVGFQFNLTAKDHGDDKHVSFVSGSIKSESSADDQPRTYRGPDLNVLRVQLFPQLYRNLHDLRLIQPLLHDFIPGSFFSDVNGLRASLENPRDGLINTTLFVSSLSDYIVEIDKESVMGPVSVLANIGGLYVFSLGVFLYLLVQCEARVKKLRNEDAVMRDIRTRRRAQKNWNKLRKFVMYTWGLNDLDPSIKSGNRPDGSIIASLSCGRCLPREKSSSRMNSSLRLGKNNNIPTEESVDPDAVPVERVGSSLVDNSVGTRGTSSHSEAEHSSQSTV